MLNQEQEVLQRLKRLSDLSNGVIEYIPTDSRTRRFLPKLVEEGKAYYTPFGLCLNCSP